MIVVLNYIKNFYPVMSILHSFNLSPQALNTKTPNYIYRTSRKQNQSNVTHRLTLILRIAKNGIDEYYCNTVKTVLR